MEVSNQLGTLDRSEARNGGAASECFFSDGRWCFPVLISKHPSRNKIVYTDMDFPTLHYLADTWRDYGAVLHKVPSRDGIGVELEDLLAAIDENTLVVPTCQVFFGSSYKQDIAAITKRAHQVGAKVVADLYQSVGAMPIDVTAWNVDYAIGGSHKYLCGG